MQPNQDPSREYQPDPTIAFQQLFSSMEALRETDYRTPELLTNPEVRMDMHTLMDQGMTWDQAATRVSDEYFLRTGTSLFANAQEREYAFHTLQYHDALDATGLGVHPNPIQRSLRVTNFDTFIAAVQATNPTNEASQIQIEEGFARLTQGFTLLAERAVLSHNLEQITEILGDTMPSWGVGGGQTPEEARELIGTDEFDYNAMADLTVHADLYLQELDRLGVDPNYTDRLRQFQTANREGLLLYWAALGTMSAMEGNTANLFNSAREWEELFTILDDMQRHAPANSTLVPEIRRRILGSIDEERNTLEYGNVDDVARRAILDNAEGIIRTMLEPLPTGQSVSPSERGGIVYPPGSIGEVYNQLDQGVADITEVLPVASDAEMRITEAIAGINEALAGMDPERREAIAGPLGEAIARLEGVRAQLEETLRQIRRYRDQGEDSEG
ncbi:MAG TPA: hypothetical protein VLH86_03335 [Patescibacteria group bacterium]|nr:hypothetical protein [Patescibacteria group bacterium]